MICSINRHRRNRHLFEQQAAYLFSSVLPKIHSRCYLNPLTNEHARGSIPHLNFSITKVRDRLSVALLKTLASFS
jgi:hypothetical protein